VGWERRATYVEWRDEGCMLSGDGRRMLSGETNDVSSWPVTDSMVVIVVTSTKPTHKRKMPLGPLARGGKGKVS
jgi:hypothetical protein